ncbi:hypothetical protein PGT21_024609 [Puccinia graminis f. sp. tritici]|uniref:Uncharacterized protein n=1 Tax=Puccinia graminis f. sp. tritici TaxID=56615 RepID=A0A5B0PYE2_PUCGR|nr:hypothetical protein PGT21_024609 [Puccinia graminis f. sp. tritici]
MKNQTAIVGFARNIPLNANEEEALAMQAKEAGVGTKPRERIHHALEATVDNMIHWAKE